MAIVYIPSQLRSITHGTDSVEIAATTIRDVVNALEDQFPGIAQRLCMEGELSPSLQVSIDGTMSSRGMLAKVQPDSEVHFIPAIGGG